MIAMMLIKMISQTGKNSLLKKDKQPDRERRSGKKNKKPGTSVKSSKAPNTAIIKQESYFQPSVIFAGLSVVFTPLTAYAVYWLMTYPGPKKNKALPPSVSEAKEARQKNKEQYKIAKQLWLKNVSNSLIALTMT